MIRFECPKCNKKLAVKESRAGGVGVCPECKGKFRIPAAPTEEEPTSSPGTKAKASEEIQESLPEVRERRRAEDADSSSNDDEAERIPRRKKKKKRRKTAWGLPAWLDPYLAALAVLGVVGLLSVGISLIWPVVSILPIGLGGLLSIAGGIWFLVIAFQDDVVAGILCLVIPFYSLYYLVTHFDAVQRPFFVQVVGVILMMLGSCVGGFSMGARAAPPRLRAAAAVCVRPQRLSPLPASCS
jgi:hypothetical protein